MKYIILVFSMLFFTACSPKYKVVKEYHPPKIANSSESAICVGVCDSVRNACLTKCESAFSSCKVKAHRIANQRYAAKMQKYTTQLESYVNNIDDYRFDRGFMNFSYVGYGYPYYYNPRYHGYANSLFWYDPMPFYTDTYLPPKPKKPSLEQEKLKAEAEFCDLDCGCTQKFDNCYTGCGGQIVSKKICIENCPK